VQAQERNRYVRVVALAAWGHFDGLGVFLAKDITAVDAQRSCFVHAELRARRSAKETPEAGGDGWEGRHYYVFSRGQSGDTIASKIIGLKLLIAHMEKAAAMTGGIDANL
jgi:hypothetical protein